MLMIRKGMAEDLEEISEIEHRVFPKEAWSDSELLYSLKKNQTLVVEDTEDDAVIAYLVARKDHPDHCYIDNLAVALDRRKEGHGTYLLLAAVDACRKKGMKTIALHVAVTNKVAITLYKTVGFIKVDVLGSYYANGTDAYVFQKVL